MFVESNDRWSGTPKIESARKRKSLSPEEELMVARGKIDVLDKEIARLLVERLTLAGRLSSVKRKLDLPVYDSTREREVVAQVAQASTEPAISQAISVIYQSVMAESKRLQNEQKEKSAQPFPKVAIIGLGLIGGALARQIRRLAPETKIIAVDRREVIHKALRENLIDAGQTRLSKSLKDVSLVLLACDPKANMQLLKRLALLLGPGQVVVDVGSVKSDICRLAEDLDLHNCDFVGGHPLFGSEKSGLAASREINPDGKVFCLSPTAKTSQIALKRLCQWLSVLNMKVEVVDSGEHDQAMASLSHALQMLAVAFGSSIARGRSNVELKALAKLKGTAFGQISRLMGSPPALWAEIVRQNKEAVHEALIALQGELSALSAALSAEDEACVQSTVSDLFQQASRLL